MDKFAVDTYNSWIVAAASCIIFLLVSCPCRLGAQLFVTMLHHYDTTRSAASFPFALASLMRSVAGPFAGLLSGVLGLQGVTVLGCFLATVGIGGCYFAKNIGTVDVCLGLVLGIGFGWSTALIPIILNQHFKKHRAKAYGIFMGGSALGAFIAPPILEVILNKYGMSGSFLLMCGFIFNCVPCALLLTKPNVVKTNVAKQNISQLFSKISNKESLYPRENTAVNDDFKSEEIKKCKEGKESSSFKAINNSACFTSDKNSINDYVTIFSNETGKISKNNDSVSTVPPNKELFDITINSQNHHSRMEGKIANESESLNLGKALLLNVNDLNKHIGPTNSKLKNEQNKTKNSETLPKNAVKSFVSSIDVFWDPIFIVLTCLQSSNNYVNYVFWTITVDVVRDKDITGHLEVYCVMGMSLFDMFGRFFLGSIIDSGILSITNFGACCFTLMCLCCLLLTCISTFSSTMIVVCMLGLAFGANTATIPTTVTKFIDKEKRTMAMSSRLIMYIPMSFTISPCIGYFRGQLGSYNGYLYLMASMSLINCIVILLLPRFVNSINQRKSDKK